MTGLELPDVAERVLRCVDALRGQELTTYGDVAAVVGTGPRQVGAVMRRYGHLTQWWRVVAADGRCHDPQRAAEFLAAVGVPVCDGRVRLVNYRVCGLVERVQLR